MKNSLNFKYTIQQIFYWAAVAGVISFASSFLLEKGFTAAQIGALLACGNILSCALQPVLADRADRAGPHLINLFIITLTVICLACLIVIQFVPVPMWIFGALYVTAVFSVDAMIPLFNALCVAYNKVSHSINYGLGRGLGSFAYAVAALGIGKVIAGHGSDWMVWIVLVLMGSNLLIALTYPKLAYVDASDVKRAECCSISVFFRRYKWYCLSLLGVMLLALFHMMTENYLIKILGRLGGDSSSVGIALFVATTIEMPVVIYIEKIRKRLNDNLLFKLAGLSFLLKAVLLLFAPSVRSIYFIQLLQATSYSFLAPVQLFYANNKVCQSDMVKGQAFITAAYTLGCAIGNFLGGQLLDMSGVMALLIAGVIVAAAGTAILFVTVEKYDSATQEEKNAAA